MSLPGADNRILDASSSRRGTPGQVFRALLVGCAVGLVFGSGPIAGWTRDLPDGPMIAPVQDIAVGWDHAMSWFGADRPYDWLHGLVRGMRAGD